VGSDANLLVLDLPDSVHAMVMARVDALSADALLTLKVASVIGHSFSLATLAAIHPLSAGVFAATSSSSRTPGAPSPNGSSDRYSDRYPERYKAILSRMQNTCNQLVRHALLRPCALYTEGGPNAERRGGSGIGCGSRRSSISSEASSVSALGGVGATAARARRSSGEVTPESADEHDYVFVSQLVREGVYNMLPFAQRARLHGAVAATLEREMAARDASETAARRRLGLATYEGTAAFATLGSHWRAARKLGRAQAYTQRAAQCAASLHEVAWARSLLESALAISEEREEAASRADRNSAATDRNSVAGNSAAADRNSAAADRNSAAGAGGSDRESGGGTSGVAGADGVSIAFPLGGNGGGGDTGAADHRLSERLLGPPDLEREIATLRRLEAWGGRAADTGGRGAEPPPTQVGRSTSTPCWWRRYPPGAAVLTASR
jgi:hypothetical protein